ncbi:LysR family transcriptional regulator [Xylophilus sp.]|uniref:LysR family transcriptional regulator n=1 Tax=Xylophilus sp. TaxID=2653893 RepID=UPI0013BE547A|nr:LysR family transcriptional regulator [Xylophilus sp.]KAF1044640.1 MAG: HTH-type transcriptional regulator TfdS [Xylophilus sp.]
MELRHLRYFLAVAETENVRAASEQLHVTQPAISRQIHDLEDELGVLLFERTPRGLRLNANGRAFLEDATALMTGLQTACERVRRVSRGEIGSLKIGFVEIAGWEGIIPEAIQRYRIAAPDVHLEPLPLASPEQLAQIHDGTLDGGFVYLFGNRPEGIDTVPLCRHGTVLAMLRGSPLAAAPRVRLRDLNERAFVAFQRSVYPAYFDALLVACTAAGLVPRIVQHVRTEAAVLSLVTAGIGLALVNDRNRFRAPSQVTFVEAKDLRLELPLSFAYRTDTRNPAVRALVEMLHAMV